MDNDSFEQSLRELLQEPAAREQSERVLERVLKTANRQTGAGALLDWPAVGWSPYWWALKARRHTGDRFLGFPVNPLIDTRHANYAA